MWFNSPYYHLLYQHRCEAEAVEAMDALWPLMGLQSGDKVLDLGCGKGRLSWPLARRGLSVTGMDLGEDNIIQARLTAAEQGLDVTFQTGNMLDGVTPGPYHAILNWFTSFGFFDDLDSHALVIKQAADQLMPGGWMRFDFMNILQVQQGLEPVSHVQFDGIDFNLTRRMDGPFVIKDIHVVDGLVEQRFSERVYGLTEMDFHAMYREAGLEPLKTWGDYQGGAFHKDSPRMITGAVKAM